MAIELIQDLIILYFNCMFMFEVMAGVKGTYGLAPGSIPPVSYGCPREYPARVAWISVRYPWVSPRGPSGSTA